MRWWPSRGTVAPPDPPAETLLVTEEVLRRSVGDIFHVREREIRGGVFVFRGQLGLAPDRALDALTTRLAPLGYTPFLRRDGATTVLTTWPLASPAGPRRIGLNVLLFLLTCVSTLLAGGFFSGSPTFDALRATPTVGWFLAGIPFAATVLAILGVHEFGHYFAARYYRASVSLPYFIPAPPPLFLFGTLGAVIRMRSHARDRNSIFDIAAAGPLAGLAVAIPAMLLGLAWSSVTTAGSGHVVFGNSLLMSALVRLQFGVVPEGMMVWTHPMADAAWAGFFVTALNLFPVGQLDGGRIAYALFGRRHRLVGQLTIVATVLLGVVTGSVNWFFWAGLVMLMIGFSHQPPLDDISPLSPGRRALGLACLLLFVLLLPPIPLSID
jgi:membrane-associated protease RseP (regulator of RpoE activity)